MNDDFPAAAFRFSVFIEAATSDASFREVSGISEEIDTELVREGGENRFAYQLPKAVKPSRLVLKRGVAPLQSPLVIWCRRTFEAGLGAPLSPRLLKVSLLDADSNPLRSWSFANAWPVKWSVDGFQSQKNEVAMESVELVYTALTRTE